MKISGHRSDSIFRRYDITDVKDHDDASEKIMKARRAAIGTKISASNEEVGVGNGNRTRNRWSHSPVLCQLSYSHRGISL